MDITYLGKYYLLLLTFLHIYNCIIIISEDKNINAKLCKCCNMNMNAIAGSSLDGENTNHGMTPLFVFQ